MAGTSSDRLGELITVISADREDLVADVLTDDDLSTLKHLAKKDTPANSLRALTSDLTYLEAWARSATSETLIWPAPEGLALKFIAHHLYDSEEQRRDPGRGMPAAVADDLQARDLLRTTGTHAPSTVRRRLSSWATLHRLRGLEGPFSNPTVREAIKRAVKATDRRLGRKSKKAIVREVLEHMLDTCGDGGPAALRDRALLLVAFGSGGRRRSELARLRVDQLVEELPVHADPRNPDSPLLACFTLELGRAKTTDAEDTARVKLVGRPATALAEWLASERITEGYVFRAVDRWETVGEGPLSPDGINDIVKRRLTIAGYDPANYSAHGLRAGYLTQAAKDGVPLPEAMRQSQHRSVQQAANYYNDAEAALSRAARLMD